MTMSLLPDANPAFRVLVADDEVVTVELLTTILRVAGHDVVGVTSCFDALARAVADPVPEIILLDALMPFLSGVEVCRRLRALERTRTVPIGIISSADEADIPWAEAGADAFLSKPFTVRALPEFVSRLMGRPEIAHPGPVAGRGATR